ncbi:hypothetical protein SDC9_188831 [bioreactor metagenome]|uniref:Uncharacterized protein n=1 Tax=bioreactor metagenome TaxID=1076179 RepID=A0A645HQF5_9ZZZZ
MRPISSSVFMRSRPIFEKRTSRKPSAMVSSTSPVKAPPNVKVCPARAFFPGRTMHSQTPSPRSRKSKNSTAEGPDSRTPKMRAGMTLLSFRTRISPGRRRVGNCEKTVCPTFPVTLSSVKSLEASRRSSGVWAMSSCGRS